MTTPQSKPRVDLATDVHGVRDMAADGSAPSARAPLAMLLAGHVLQDGEVVLLLLKPSRWFVLLSSLRMIAAAAILAIAGWKLVPHLWGASHLIWAQLFLLVTTARLGWAVLVWMGRFYLLTDLRVVRVSGVFQVEVQDCPLRRVARTRLLFSTRERLTRLGTIEITCADEAQSTWGWQMIRRPRDIQEQIEQAVARARQGGGHGC
jgi:hypothetical protein